MRVAGKIIEAMVDSPADCRRLSIYQLVSFPVPPLGGEKHTHLGNNYIVVLGVQVWETHILTPPPQPHVGSIRLCFHIHSTVFFCSMISPQVCLVNIPIVRETPCFLARSLSFFVQMPGWCIFPSLSSLKPIFVG